MSRTGRPNGQNQPESPESCYERTGYYTPRKGVKDSGKGYTKMTEESFCKRDTEMERKARERYTRQLRLRRAKAMREYTAACVELVERLAGLPLGAEVYRCATHAREIVAKKPTSAEAQGE